MTSYEEAAARKAAELGAAETRQELEARIRRLQEEIERLQS